ncbi:MAG: penicillin-binding protein activator [Desulfovibrionaceae bacterium]|nr:penicillin-binding protein activator [Desulfovibrionaceae bacterium]
MKRSSGSLLFTLTISLGVIFSLLLLTGCPKSTIVGKPGVEQPTQPGKPITKPVQEQPEPSASTPEEFYELGEYGRAERLAGALIADKSLPALERREAWLYYILSAAANNHVHLAQQALKNWSADEPGIENDPVWHDAWMGVTLRFPAEEAREKAQAASDPTQLPTLRARAQAVLALKADNSSGMGSALEGMTNFYNAMSAKEKAGFEHIFADQLRWQQPGLLGELYSHINAENAIKFPYTIINLEQGRRMLFASSEEQRNSGRQIVESLASSGLLANPQLAQNIMDQAAAREDAISTLPGNMPSKGTVALLLPLQGRYASYAHKISTGAQAAQHALAQSGVGATVVVIDTETPGWQQQLAALPKSTVIGGPLTRDAYDRIKAASLLQGRAVFAFMSQLPAGEEGSLAWRFFSSPQDQISALLEFCRSLGIYGIASFYPSDSYGKRMNDNLIQAVGAYGINVTPLAYPADSPDAWSGSVRDLLQKRAASPFDAVFLPDTWPNAKGIVPYIFFNREDRLLIMGTTLWEQSLYKDRTPDASYFRLGVFPGAWDSEGGTPAHYNLLRILTQMGAGTPGSAAPGIPGLNDAKADFWYALGFDFVRFGMNMGLPDSGIGEESWTAQQVNSRLQQAQHIDWSMAPLYWDESGLASQQLFLFTPTENGFAAITQEEMQRRIEETKRMHGRRWSN